MRRLYAVCWLAALSACSGSLGNLNADNPTERGLSYVAAAIVTAAIIRGCMND